ncbi:MAG: DUF4886 domain-containing protein [Tannerella sp.]|jgi:hypothetical protein|nr:DUF4886 domain-containing protein [Tannerella sp.]
MTLKVLILAFAVLMQHNAAFTQTISENVQQKVTQEQFFVPNFKNNPLPKYPKTLKILGVGNSFTDDAMQYLPNLLESAGINNVTLGKMSIGGCSLERHYNMYVQDTAAYTYVKSIEGKNIWSEPVKTTFKQGVGDENWDVIIIQQVSQNAGIYQTYQPYLNDLIDVIRANCTNAGVTLGWQMTWAYSTNSNHDGFANYNKCQTEMYQAIVNAVKTMTVMTGIDLVIPSATAIQNLRGTSVNNAPADLTRDGSHIDFGAGRYTLACTWFQALIAPCLGKTIVGNTCRIDNGNVPVTEDNFLMCQKAAQFACSRRFEVSILEK